MPLYSPYSGPEKVKYLFIDGGCLDSILETLSNGLFEGTKLEIDYYKLATGVQKIFYYDCLPAKKQKVADFDDTQIREFATKWFQTKDPKKAEQFIQKLQQNRRIQELASNPLLLTLLCLLFGESTDFPSNRSELQQEGVDILLKKWDGQRNIERDKVYKKLSYERKEDLLSTIALTTFESGNYFFKKELAKGYIRNYIQNLPDAQTDPDALLLDSEAVLKSIEAQHGLLVEQARGIYSFSHLTFHEFFTARNIALSRNPQQVFQQLVSGT